VVDEQVLDDLPTPWSTGSQRRGPRAKSEAKRCEARRAAPQASAGGGALLKRKVCVSFYFWVSAASISAIACSLLAKRTAAMPSSRAVSQFTSRSSTNTHSSAATPPRRSIVNR
jgi:hypothetical protein